MTDRTISLLVTLNQIQREDDVEHICDAIKLIKGVLNAEVVISCDKDWLNRQAMKNQIKDLFFNKLISAFDEIK